MKDGCREASVLFVFKRQSAVCNLRRSGGGSLFAVGERGQSGFALEGGGEMFLVVEIETGRDVGDRQGGSGEQALGFAETQVEVMLAERCAGLLSENGAEGGVAEVAVPGEGLVIDGDTELLRKRLECEDDAGGKGLGAGGRGERSGEFGLNASGGGLEGVDAGEKGFRTEARVDAGEPEGADGGAVGGEDGHAAAVAAGNLLGEVGGVAVLADLGEVGLETLVVGNGVWGEPVEGEVAEECGAAFLGEEGHEGFAGRGGVQRRGGFVLKAEAGVVGAANAVDDEVFEVLGVKHGKAVGLGHLVLDGEQEGDRDGFERLVAHRRAFPFTGLSIGERAVAGNGDFVKI